MSRWVGDGSNPSGYRERETRTFDAGDSSTEEIRDPHSTHDVVSKRNTAGSSRYAQYCTPRIRIRTYWFRESTDVNASPSMYLLGQLASHELTARTLLSLSKANSRSQVYIACKDLICTTFGIARNTYTED